MPCPSRVYFGDTAANVYALDAETGRQLWVRPGRQHALARVTGSTTLFQGRLYVGVSSYEEAQGADPRYRLLHVPRRCQRPRRGERYGGLAHARSSPSRCSGGAPARRACRCGGRRNRAFWSPPTARCVPAMALRGHRQRLQRPGAREQQRRDRPRPPEWRRAVDPPGHAERRLHRRLPPGNPNCPDVLGPGRRLRQPAHADTHERGARPDRHRTEVRPRVHARSRQRRRNRLAVPRGAGQYRSAG